LSVNSRLLRVIMHFVLSAALCSGLVHALQDVPSNQLSETFTGSPEAVTRLRLPQIVACGFPALRSSADDSQHCKSLQLRVRETQLWLQ
jgi:hypothetical protein